MLYNANDFLRKTHFVLLLLMNLQLWEGEFYLLTVEFLINLFVQIKVHGPIIGSLNPHSESEVDAAVCQSAEGNESLRVF